jgi:hypothetical protein
VSAHARACRHTDATLRAAVALWFDDKAAAVARYGPIGDWDTRDVESMRDLFRDRAHFDEDIGRWNVGGVVDMSGMFRGAASFNQPLDKWDVSSVKYMRCMFDNAHSFNQPLDKWDVSSVVDMGYMFDSAASFNQPLERWAVADGTDKTDMFYEMFTGARSFKQPATLTRFGLVLPSPPACAQTRARTPSDRVGSLDGLGRARQHRRAHIGSVCAHVRHCSDSSRARATRTPSSVRRSLRSRPRTAVLHCARVVCGAQQR